MATSPLTEDRRRQLDSIVSQMESNGEAPEDIQFVVEDFKGKYGQGVPQETMAETASAAVSGVPIRPMGGPAEMVKRLAMDTFEGFRPPINMEEARRAINPNLGQFGPNRFAQDVIEAAREAAPKQAEAFVQQPGINRFPNAAAAIGTLGQAAPFMIPSPKDIPLMVGGGKLLGLAKSAEMAVRRGGAKVGKALISAISPAKHEAVLARFENPQAVKTGLTREQLGGSVVASQNKLSQQIGELDEVARATLSNERTIPKQKIVNHLQQIKKRYVGSSRQAVSGEARAELAEIDNAIEGVSGLNPLPDIPAKRVQVGERVDVSGPLPVKTPIFEEIPAQTNRSSEMISEKQVKDVFMQYKNINWNDPVGGAKKEIRKSMDAILKRTNKAYERAMKPVAERAKLQAVVNKKLSLKYDPTTGTYATDATAGKWSPALLEGKRPETSMALRRLGKLTDNDLLGKARMTNFREQFEGGKTQGSRMVQLGRHVGGVPGAMVGAVIDKVGGDVSGRLIDALSAAGRFSIPSMPVGADRLSVLALSNALQSRRKRGQNAQ